MVARNPPTYLESSERSGGSRASHAAVVGILILVILIDLRHLVWYSNELPDKELETATRIRVT